MKEDKFKIINLIKESAKDKLVLIVTHNFKEVEGIVTRKIKKNIIWYSLY